MISFIPHLHLAEREKQREEAITKIISVALISNLHLSLSPPTSETTPDPNYQD
jgi:hypothetical protein